MKFRTSEAVQGMMGRVLRALAAVLLSVLVAGPAAATHSATEPSDGTVGSFQKVSPPRVLEDFSFYDSDGRVVRLSDFHGKVVLLNLWATWCPPCIRELPALDRLQGKLGGESFMVLSLSLDRVGRKTVERFFRRLGINNLSLFVDPGHATSAAFPIDVLPATFVLDREGRMVSFLRSYADWDAPEAADMIRAHLGGSGD
jgi:thiol-disulfide isomerase/thioredoxin